MLNVLFITADQWRGECLGVAGHPLVRTPNLDALAAEGTLFQNHYANAAPCSPARATLYTGLYQMTNRVVRNGSPLSDRFDNIARAGRRQGYSPTLFGYTDQSADPTVLAPNDPWLRTYEGILPGFDVRARLAEDEKPWLSWLRRQGLDFPDRETAHLPVRDIGRVSNAPPGYGAGQTQTAYLAERFADWLGEQDGPWFAHLSFLRPHPPFIVPEPYNTMVSPDAVPPFRRAESVEAEAAVHPLMAHLLRRTKASSFAPGTTGLVAELGDADFRQIRATYYGMIAEVDAQLGQVFAAVRAAGAWDDTLIVFMSDHAELLGDHHMLGKGGYHDESQHVPLILRVPGARRRGNRVTAFTEHVDLYPTLLELIGATPGNVGDGRSLTPFLDGETPAGWRDEVHWEFDFRDVAGQATEAAFGLDSTRLNLAVVRTARWKYVHFASLPPLLFDLEADPANVHNLAGDPACAAARIEMAERLLAWRARHLDQSLALKELTPDGVISRSAVR